MADTQTQQKSGSGTGAGQARTGGHEQPYIGRNVIVGFAPTRSGGDFEQRAAIITKINGDDTCMLHVFNPDGGTGQPMKASYSPNVALNCWTPIAQTINT
jgi:hypothetical protein